jgi:hypothetical protein
MASPIGELSRRSADAYVSYVRAVGELTTEYARGVVGFARERLSKPDRRSRVTASDPAPAAADLPSLPPASLVLEGAAGSAARGAFVVENALDRPVDATVVASALYAPDGRRIDAAVVFEPSALELGPGSQAVVQVAVGIDAAMPSEADLHGELRVPGLSGTTIPFVVRRVGR